MLTSPESEFHRPTPCCLCDGEAVAIYYLPHGCAARPELTVQPLCAQHECNSSPVKGMELLKDLRIRPPGRDEPLYPRRTFIDRRRDVLRIMTEHPEFSNRRIAFIASVSREMVNAVRSNMIRFGRLENQPRIGADGKTYRRHIRPRSKEARPCAPRA